MQTLTMVTHDLENYVKDAEQWLPSKMAACDLEVLAMDTDE